MLRLHQFGDFNRVVSVLASGAVVLLGMWLPIFGFSAQPSDHVVSSPDGCTKKLMGRLDRPVREVTIAARYDTKTHKYVATTWSRQDFSSDEFVTSVYRTDEVISSVEPLVDLDAFARYLAEISPLVELANKSFETRRGWGGQHITESGENPFSKKNLQVARDYLTLSSYVIVRDRVGRLLGGMRNIQLRDQDSLELPEEKFLHIRVPQMGLARTAPGFVSWKNEAGTFVIEQDLPPEVHQKVRLEIWTHLYQFIFSKGSVRANFYDQAVHTYGDRKSVIMYRASGFQKLRIYYHNGKWVDYTRLAEKDIPPIMVNDTPWWPLVLLPQDALALNEKFSTGLRAHVDPLWLESRRREMSDPEVSTLQMGALFPNLLADLESSRLDHFLAALTGLATIIESVSEHMRIAKTAFYDHSINARAIQEVIKIRDQISQLIRVLSLKIGTMTPEKRHAIVLFSGHILQLKGSASNFMFNSEFLQRLVIPFLDDIEMGNADAMMVSMCMARTPKEWLEETNLVWDLSLDSEDEFAHDTKIAEGQLTKQLRDAAFTDAQIDSVASRLQAALFLPPVLRGDLNSAYSYDDRASRLATLTLLAVTKGKSEKIPYFIKLAAARQYLLDRSKIP